ncbi:MAG: ComF family protein [Actinomycetia bacterium]|nr:ComF family protein [Actinomycetes bacterium]
MPEQSIFDFLKDMVHPAMCAACGKNCPEFLCSDCLSEIIPIDINKCCPYCGKPLPLSGAGEVICSSCREPGLNFTRHRSFTLYSGNMKRVIKKFKYSRIYGLDNVLSGFLYKTYRKYFNSEQVDYVETVPGEHTKKLAERFSKIVKIPFKNNIIKIRDTRRQSGLDLGARRINILDAFKLKDCLVYKDKNVLILDDVWTTGSTLKEACRIVHQGGARKVFLLTLARGA